MRITYFFLCSLFIFACDPNPEKLDVDSGIGLHPSPDDREVLPVDRESDGGSFADASLTDASLADAAQTADAQAAIPDASPEPSHWSPSPGSSWQIQLTGAVDTSIGADIYDLDLFDVPASTFANLQAQGVKIICYFSAGSYEEWREDADDFPKSTLGKKLSGWPGEKWVDIRSQTVRDIMLTRLDLAESKGCDAVDPDNVDGYSNQSGFPLTYQDQLDYNKFLATAAHSRGMAVGLKNDLDQVSDLIDHFDFAVNEQCLQWNECSTLSPFIQVNKPVFHIEYTEETDASQACPQVSSLGFDTVIKNLDLGAWRDTCP